MKGKQLRATTWQRTPEHFVEFCEDRGSVLSACRGEFEREQDVILFIDMYLEQMRPTHLRDWSVCVFDEMNSESPTRTYYFDNEVSYNLASVKKKNMRLDINIHEFTAIKNLSELHLRRTMTPAAAQLWAIYWNGDVISSRGSALVFFWLYCFAN